MKLLQIEDSVFHSTEVGIPQQVVLLTLVAMIPPKLLVKSLALWFTDIRKVALITFIASALSLPIPVWNAMQTWVAIESTRPQIKWWMIPVVLFTYLFAAILPAFYFSLFRNKGTLRFPKRLRLLALAGACTYTVIVLIALPEWGRSWGPYVTAMTMLDWRAGATNVLTFVRDPRTIGQLSTVLGEFSNLASIMLLIAVFRWAGDPLDTDVPTSKLLRLVTKVAVITWGLVVAFLLVRLASMPFIFFQLRESLVKIGRRPPLLGDMMAEAMRTLLSQACLLAVPYIVYRSQRKRVESPVDPQSGNGTYRESR